MYNLFKKYQKIDQAITYPIFAEFFLQLINSSFITILLIYMAKEGYEDYESADLMAYRFLGILLLAFPFGIVLKSVRIIPFFKISSILTPTMALGIIYAISIHNSQFVKLTMLLWGVSLMCSQVAILPYILRNTPTDLHTEAISLSYSTWSLGGIFSGLLIFSLKNIWPNTFDEKVILEFLCGISFLGVFFAFSINRPETKPPKSASKWDLANFDWRLIINAMVPTLIIATGAGLTIPFVGLFFFKIHGLDSDGFALLSAATTIIVFIVILLVPNIKERFGYKKGITISQCMAVLCLVILALTEHFQGYHLALFVAMACYAMRQPLMNMAAPLTSDLTMKYVGPNNQEMISALTAAIWSGSWFLSSKIFQILRELNVRYVYIFLITAALYSIGVGWYYWLIVQYTNRTETKKGELI